jgi:hypothetical protein
MGIFFSAQVLFSFSGHMLLIHYVFKKSMLGTFSQIYIQVVFAVQGRQNKILPFFEDEVFKYISGIIKAKEQKSLAVNGMADHIHILTGLRPGMRILKTTQPIS